MTPVLWRFNITVLYTNFQAYAAVEPQLNPDKCESNFASPLGHTIISQIATIPYTATKPSWYDLYAANSKLSLCRDAPGPAHSCCFGPVSVLG